MMLEGLRTLILVVGSGLLLFGLSFAGCPPQPSFEVSIQCQAETAEEEACIALAEAHCPAPEEILAEFPNTVPPEDGECLWWYLPHDEARIREAYAITADAVAYYEALIRGWEAANLRRAAWVRYEAHVEHDVAHPENPDERVVAVHLSLDWGYVCGGLCGSGCEKTRTVFIDAAGTVVGVVGDGRSLCWIA